MGTGSETMGLSEAKVPALADTVEADSLGWAKDAAAMLGTLLAERGATLTVDRVFWPMKSRTP